MQWYYRIFILKKLRTFSYLNLVLTGDITRQIKTFMIETLSRYLWYVWILTLDEFLWALLW